MINTPLEKVIFPEEGQGNASSVEALFREHNHTLLRFLQSRLNNEADAREAAQESYVRLLQLDQENQPSFLRAYLFRIAANVATDVLRKRRTRGPVELAEAADQPEPATQEERLAARQELDLVSAALAELPPRCREAFLLSRNEGWSTQQIGSHLNVTDRMVRLYLVRALEHIQLAVSRPTPRGGL
jgi:RNA polymerase sigma factor (sigma-70 family)